MDTNSTSQIYNDLGCYRLRTARQKKRMQYEDFEKQLRHLNKEQRDIWNTQRNLGWEPLTPPIQRGWKRYFILRDDVARSRHADFFERILERINTVKISHRKDFKVKKRKFGRKVYVVKPQFLKVLDKREWQKADFTDAEARYFTEVWEYNTSGVYINRFIFNEPWRYQTRVRPNVIDKVRITDSLLESRSDEIRNYLKRTGYEHQLERMNGGYRLWSWWYKEPKKHIDPLKNKPLYRIIEEAQEEKWP